MIGEDSKINFDVTTKKQTVKDLLDIFKQQNFLCLNNEPTRGNASRGNL